MHAARAGINVATLGSSAAATGQQALPLLEFPDVLTRSTGFRSAVTVASAILGFAGGASEASAQRRVEGTAIISDTMAAVRLEFDADLTYVGTQTVMLSRTTHAEQHFFVESDGGRIERLYWIQFEGKPAGSGRPYDYSGDPTIEFGGQTADRGVSGSGWPEGHPVLNLPQGALPFERD